MYRKTFLIGRVAVFGMLLMTAAAVSVTVGTQSEGAVSAPGVATFASRD